MDFDWAKKDVFLNITGGLRVDDPALDLAVIAAIPSSNADAPISQSVFCRGSWFNRRGKAGNQSRTAHS